MGKIHKLQGFSKKQEVIFRVDDRLDQTMQSDSRIFVFESDPTPEDMKIEGSKLTINSLAVEGWF